MLVPRRHLNGCRKPERRQGDFAPVFARERCCTRVDPAYLARVWTQTCAYRDYGAGQLDRRPNGIARTSQF